MALDNTQLIEQYKSSLADAINFSDVNIALKCIDKIDKLTSGNRDLDFDPKNQLTGMLPYF